MQDANGWIHRLALQRHPEGGWFRETYRSSEILSHLPPRFPGPRCFSTAIYYLLESGDFSALHRLRQDEAWHFYDGSSLTLHLLSPEGTYSTRQLGRSVGEPQTVVPGGWYFAASVDQANSYTLSGCTVAPGFDFADFEMPRRDELLRQFPQHHDLISRLTR